MYNVGSLKGERQEAKECECVSGDTKMSELQTEHTSAL